MTPNGERRRESVKALVMRELDSDPFQGESLDGHQGGDDQESGPQSRGEGHLIRGLPQRQDCLGLGVGHRTWELMCDPVPAWPLSAMQTPTAPVG